MVRRHAGEVQTAILMRYCARTAGALMLRPHTLRMTPRLFRPATPRSCPYSPSWKQWRGLLAVEAARCLAALGRLFPWRVWRVVLVILGSVLQLVLALLTWYLTDLAISLMEVWAELARKHLELTL